MNAECSTLGSKIRCTCKPGYEGDGRICVPKNPCNDNNGGCPFNSTYCVFEGPDKVWKSGGDTVGITTVSLLFAPPLSVCLSPAASARLECRLWGAVQSSGVSSCLPVQQTPVIPLPDVTLSGTDKPGVVEKRLCP